MKLYKLTDEKGQTKGATQWGPNVTYKALGTETELCSNGWIHAYENPWIGLIMNPKQANFANPRMFEAEGEIGAREGQLKCGCRELTTLRELKIPVISTELRVTFAITVASKVYTEPQFLEWARKWLSGEDRSEAAAWAAGAAAAATGAAEWAAGAAARAAAWAAEAGAWAAGWAEAGAAEAGAWAAGADLDFYQIALEVFGEFPLEYVS